MSYDPFHCSVNGHPCDEQAGMQYAGHCVALHCSVIVTVNVQHHLNAMLSNTYINLRPTCACIPTSLAVLCSYTQSVYNIRCSVMSTVQNWLIFRRHNISVVHHYCEERSTYSFCAMDVKAKTGCATFPGEKVCEICREVRVHTYGWNAWLIT